MATPDEPRHDAHLKAALRHAPDAGLRAPPLLSAGILAAARQAVDGETPPPPRPSAWTRWFGSSPWQGAGTLAAVLLVSGVLWVQRESLPTAVTPTESPTDSPIDSPTDSSTASPAVKSADVPAGPRAEVQAAAPKSPPRELAVAASPTPPAAVVVAPAPARPARRAAPPDEALRPPPEAAHPEPASVQEPPRALAAPSPPAPLPAPAAGLATPPSGPARAEAALPSRVEAAPPPRPLAPWVGWLREDTVAWSPTAADTSSRPLPAGWLQALARATPVWAEAQPGEAGAGFVRELSLWRDGAAEVWLRLGHDRAQWCSAASGCLMARADAAALAALIETLPR